jgi:Oxidoreductase family, C-terminal alpha/beta domain
MGREQQAGPSDPHGPEEQDHFTNFIGCVISRSPERLNAPIVEGHISTALVHLANVSYRLGRTLIFNPMTEEVVNDGEANHLLRDGDRGYRTPYVVPEKV